MTIIAWYFPEIRQRVKDTVIQYELDSDDEEDYYQSHRITSAIS